jgi:hypothetical protein
MEVVKGLHRLGREEAIERFLSGLSALQVVPVDTEGGYTRRTHLRGP